MVHLWPARLRIPVRIFSKQLDIEFVQSARCANVEGALANLPDSRNTSERQKEAEVIREIGVVTGNCLAVDDIFSLDGFSVGSENELGLLLRCRSTAPQLRKSRGHFSLRAYFDMNVAPLQDAANVRMIRNSGAEFSDCRLLISERLKEREGEIRRIERLVR